MVSCLLVGDAGDLAPLSGALDRGGVEYTIVGRPVEAEQAAITSRAQVVVVSDAACDADAVRRLHRTQPERLLVAWLPVQATSRAADLLARGFVDVLHGTMGERELLARLHNAAARRPALAQDPVQRGALAVDAAHGIATWAGTDLRLTRRERELLQALAEAAPATLRREDLYRRVWGYAMARGDRAVDVNVTRLRAKLAATTERLTITTQPGVGYRLELSSVTEPAVTGL